MVNNDENGDIADDHYHHYLVMIIILITIKIKYDSSPNNYRVFW
jgi:hypothetical protein